MDITNLYTDFWELLGQYLSSDDLYSFALTCKQAWKASKRPNLMKTMSYPMSYPYRLTFEQRSLVHKLEKGTQRFKLIHGDVGSGKTIVSISYAIRNYMDDPNSKIVMCGPPSLIKMWWSTLQKYFNTRPKVLHGTNPEYYPKDSWKVCPYEKFILVSYILLGRHRNLGWFKNNRDLLIIDEAHHQTSVPVHNFKEVIGLSATTTKKSGISRGIKSVLRAFDLKAADCTYSLNKNIIARELPPVEYYPYDIPTNQDVLMMCRSMISYTGKGEQDLNCVSAICKSISHPVISDLCDSFTAGYIMVGRKSFKVDVGNGVMYNSAKKELVKEHPTLNYHQIQKKMIEKASFDILKSGSNYSKYVQAYHIIKEANRNGDKVLLFDTSVTYIPFLHKYLTGCGINSYIFSTHYDVTSRQKQLTRFKEDSNPGVLLSSINMLGEGQNVTEANHIIFFTQCSDHTRYYQAIGRCWRYPQVKNVKVHLLFGSRFDRTVYEHACGATDLRSVTWDDLL